eukprot:365530-Chlamydomonas_euryale.AAC.24
MYWYSGLCVCTLGHGSHPSNARARQQVRIYANVNFKVGSKRGWGLATCCLVGHWSFVFPTDLQIAQRCVCRCLLGLALGNVAFVTTLANAPLGPALAIAAIVTWLLTARTVGAKSLTAKKNHSLLTLRQDFAKLLSAFSDRASRDTKLEYMFMVFDVDGDGEQQMKRSIGVCMGLACDVKTLQQLAVTSVSARGCPRHAISLAFPASVCPCD